MSISELDQELQELYKIYPSSSTGEWSWKWGESSEYDTVYVMNKYGEIIFVRNRDVINLVNRHNFKLRRVLSGKSINRTRGEDTMNNVKEVWVVLNTSEVVGQESVIAIATTKKQALEELGRYVLENPDESYEYLELFNQKISCNKE